MLEGIESQVTQLRETLVLAKWPPPAGGLRAEASGEGGGFFSLPGFFGGAGRPRWRGPARCRGGAPLEGFSGLLFLPSPP